MTVRPTLVLAAAAVAVAAPLTPALAKPKEIKKSYAMRLAPLALPPEGTPTCLPADGAEGVTKHTEVLKAPAAGLLKVEVSGFYGDWDITVFDSKGRAVGIGAGTSTPNASASTGVDKATVKVKKAGTYNIVTCNFAGSPTASGKYSFVYGK